MKLTALESQTLVAWRDCETGYGFGFNEAAKLSGTPRHLVRRVVRSLARKGMLQYARALYWEDEPKMGAGYTLTEAGANRIREMVCFVCGEMPVVVNLGGDNLCRRHADVWVRSEGIAA